MDAEIQENKPESVEIILVVFLSRFDGKPFVRRADIGCRDVFRRYLWISRFLIKSVRFIRVVVEYIAIWKLIGNFLINSR